MHTYLKEETYYADLYDVHTIEECLHFIESCRKKSMETDAPPKEQIEKVINLFLYFKKGERFQKKSAFIQDCISRDRGREELLSHAVPPNSIRCSNCYGDMRVMLKDLHEVIKGPPRVIFMMECLACKKRRGVFDNGEEFQAKPEQCPKCGKAVKALCEEKGKNLIWIKTCTACGFSETEIDDFEKCRFEREKRQQHEAELLRKHRAEFCLSPKDGEEYLQAMRSMEALQEIVKHEDLRRTDPDYKKAEGINKLTVFELEKLLSEILENERYLKLSFDKPEIDRYIIIPFSVLDSEHGRKDSESALKLRRIIKKTLGESNWRLMTEGISYKLGYLSGRLKGYESEDDLVSLCKGG